MNIYVGNLSLQVTEDELRQEFVTFGTVTSVTLMSDLGIGSGRGRGCGYVEMPSTNEAESAIQRLQGKSIKGRQINIIKALPVTWSPGGGVDGQMKAAGFSRKARYYGGKCSR
jgi:RNA recognition motif-containing protein